MTLKWEVPKVGRSIDLAHPESAKWKFGTKQRSCHLTNRSTKCSCCWLVWEETASPKKGGRKVWKTLKVTKSGFISKKFSSIFDSILLLRKVKAKLLCIWSRLSSARFHSYDFLQNLQEFSNLPQITLGCDCWFSDSFCDVTAELWVTAHLSSSLPSALNRNLSSGLSVRAQAEERSVSGRSAVRKATALLWVRVRVVIGPHLATLWLLLFLQWNERGESNFLSKIRQWVSFYVAKW